MEKVRKADVLKKHSRYKYTELILIKIKIGSVAGILEKLEILNAAQPHPYSTSSGPPGKLGLRPLLSGTLLGPGEDAALARFNYVTPVGRTDVELVVRRRWWRHVGSKDSLVLMVDICVSLLRVSLKVFIHCYRRAGLFLCEEVFQGPVQASSSDFLLSSRIQAGF